MSRHVRWTVLAALAALALVAVPAAANIVLSETRLRATGSSVTFRASEGGINVVCAVTLTATLRREIASAERTQLGEVTESRVERCTGGTITLLAGNWPVRVISFRQGQLRLQFENIAFLMANAAGTARCLYRGATQVINEEDPINRLRLVESVSLALNATLRESLPCPRSVTLAGSLTATAELGYTESEPRGRPLQPTAAILEFAEIQQTKNMEFTNEWIITTVTSNSGVGAGAPRFLPFAEVTECFALERIAPGGRCTDRIRLIRAREAGELVSVPYEITLLGVSVGRVTLER
jgi:hypothetical protein